MHACVYTHTHTELWEWDLWLCSESWGPIYPADTHCRPSGTDQPTLQASLCSPPSAAFSSAWLAAWHFRVLPQLKACQSVSQASPHCQNRFSSLLNSCRLISRSKPETASNVMAYDTWLVLTRAWNSFCTSIYRYDLRLRIILMLRRDILLACRSVIGGKDGWCDTHTSLSAQSCSVAETKPDKTANSSTRSLDQVLLLFFPAVKWCTAWQVLLTYVHATPATCLFS